MSISTGSLENLLCDGTKESRRVFSQSIQNRCAHVDIADFPSPVAEIAIKELNLWLARPAQAAQFKAPIELIVMRSERKPFMDNFEHILHPE
jgi:hypothetical protein